MSEPSVTWLYPDPPKADRKLLSALLIELARSLNQDVAAKVPSLLAADPRLEEMRHILFGRERALLERLQQQLDDPEQLALSVSQILPQAFGQAVARDERMGRMLAPTIEAAAESSIKKNPRALTDILYPVMGPAIRKSIGESLDATIESLNAALKHTFSWQGLKWRFEALRTGTSFADVVLKHTVVYRVEHVFLIHKRTGLLIEHVAADEIAAKDPQLVSAMLSAIQDFVRDSFAGTGSSELDTVRLGELLLWCEQAPQALLAAVIRGNPPEHLHELMRDTLRNVHKHRHQALEDFDGDSGIFPGLDDELRDCLRKQEKARKERISPLLWALPLALLCAGGYWFYQRQQENNHWARYVNALEAEPGIVVIGSEKRDGAWHVTGLHDPLAADPHSLLVNSSLDPDKVIGHWEPYQALHPTIALKRIQATLDPPGTVSLTLEEGSIRASGSASRQWLAKARTLISLLPVGAPVFDISTVEEIGKAEYEKLRAAIQSHVIHFNHGAPSPTPGQESKLDALAADLRELQTSMRRLGLMPQVTLTGHTDSTGKETSNLSLSLGRAEVVRSLLKRRGVDPDLLSIRGAGALEPLQEGATGDELLRNRRVTFTVGILE
jgi:OOP family OmpA-OmpF porin